MRECNFWDVGKLSLQKFLITVACVVAEFPICRSRQGSRIPYLNFHILQIWKAAFRGTAPTTIVYPSRQQQDLRREATATSATERLDDEEDERWNMVAAECDINMLGPTISTHDCKEWVYLH